MLRFKDRVEAGKKLAAALSKYKNKEGLLLRNKNAVVYSLPRGGVVLGAEIAQGLNLPHDLVITRKIGHPLSPEYAIGAVAENGHTVVNQNELAGVDRLWFEEEVARQRREARRRRESYLKGLYRPSVKGKTAILVDDGIATGYTMAAAIKEVKHLEPSQIMVAIPIAPVEVIKRIEKEVDQVVTLAAPVDFFGAIGYYYDDFTPVADEQVRALMRAKEAVTV